MTQTEQHNQTTREKWAEIIKDFYQIWISERPTQFAAAMAYYAIFSIIPVIYVASWLADLIFSRLSIADWFYNQITLLLGAEAMLYIQEGVEGLELTTSNGSVFTSIIGFVAILFSASLIFYQIQHAINTLWKVPPLTRGATKALIRNRLHAFVMLLGVFLFLTLAAISNLLVSIVAEQVRLNFLITLLGFVLLAGLATVSFALIFRILPNAEVGWRYIWIGSSVSAVLIAFVVKLIGAYLSASKFGSAMEAAGGMAVLLIAFYFLGQIFVLGTILIRVLVANAGEAITPRQA